MKNCERFANLALAGFSLFHSYNCYNSSREFQFSIDFYDHVIVSRYGFLLIVI